MAPASQVVEFTINISIFKLIRSLRNQFAFINEILFCRGDLCLIDWKKSDKRKDTIESIYDAPTQVASYIGAINADLNYPFEVS